MLKKISENLQNDQNTLKIIETLSNLQITQNNLEKS